VMAGADGRWKRPGRIEKTLLSLAVSHLAQGGEPLNELPYPLAPPDPPVLGCDSGGCQHARGVHVRRAALLHLALPL